MANTLENNISTVIIEKGKGVISAIRSAFPSLTKWEVFSMAKSACAELKGKIRPNDICAVVQPGQVIELSIPKKDPNIGKIETLAGYQGSEGFEKHTDPSGKVTYMLDGKEIPKIQKGT